MARRNQQLLNPLFHKTCSKKSRDISAPAYYGPNADVIGDIKNSNWQYVAVTDIWDSTKFLILFFTLDGLSLVISAILLWFFSRISLFRVFVHVQKEFGVLVSMQQLYFILGVGAYMYWLHFWAPYLDPQLGQHLLTTFARGI